MTYSSISIQGNIISSEVLEKIRTEDIRYQQPKDFQLAPTASLREEISLAWSLALSHWKAFDRKRESLGQTETGTSETRQYWMKPLLSILGYDLATAHAETINGKSYAISHRALNIDHFPIHIVGCRLSLDKRAETGGTRLSPHALVQEYLNQHEHLYALVSNGVYLRLLRDATRLSRLSYIEFNLQQMMEEELYAEFALLYRLVHASRMPTQNGSGEESIIEFYHQEALASGSRIRERLRLAVEESIKQLANGFLQHPSNEDLRMAIARQELTAADYYLYNLRLVYRLLFLMVIEERNLVYPAERDPELDRHRRIYYDYYSVQRLCRLVEKAVYVDPRKTDLWQSLVTGFTLFEQAKFGARLGIASLGSGLFDTEALGVLGRQTLGNDTLLNVLRYLVSFENEKGQRVRVNYADLDVEEFGSVYEGLLEYEPVLQDADTRPVFLFKEGNERSRSGSHYTPEELVKPLIKHSLDYLIEDKLKEKDPEAALLSLKVCDVACGSGHILLSAARRIGFELARIRSGEDQPSPPVRRQAVRDVIRHCIYGVDKNPLAVELCKVAMWLEAHNPGEPLNFLDHHIKCGDAIVGLAHKEELQKGIADEAFKTLPGDEKAIASAFLKRNKQERKQQEQAAFDFEKEAREELNAVIEQFNLFKKLPERTPEEVANKEKQYRQYESDYHRIRMKQLADAQVAQFFIPKTDANKPYLLTDTEYRGYLRQVNKNIGVLQSNKLAKAEIVATAKRFFHWFLEFPEVFNEGGFDCILGNPPFLGGQKLSGSFGDSFLEYIKHQFTPIGAVDLVTYFFRRIFTIVKPGGFQSLISTNTIAQGKAREDGLDVIIKQSGSINHAIKSTKWPGVAAVEVALVTITKQQWKGKFYLGTKEVKTITPYLDDTKSLGNPFHLKQNEGKSFQGSIVLGKGFVLEPSVAKALITKDSKNKDVLFPYLNGDDLNNNPDQQPSRWVINFFDWPEEKAKSYPDCFEIIERLVKPERQRWAIDKDGNETVGEYALRKPLPEKWWIYGEKRPALYSTIKNLGRVLVITRVSKYVNITYMPSSIVFMDKVVVLSFEKSMSLSLLQSSLYDYWAWKYSSTLGGGTINFSPNDCFETFAFPQDLAVHMERQLESLGENYYEDRKKLMLGMQLGITKTYNLFHCNAITKVAVNAKDKQVTALQKHLANTPDTISFEEAIQGILKLRELHVQMDEAVLEAYGWTDIQLRHDFYEVDYLPENDRVRFTIHPDARREVLKRLLELNHKIHEEEVKAGLWDKKKTGKRKKVDAEDGGELNRVDEPDSSYGGLFDQRN